MVGARVLGEHLRVWRQRRRMSQLDLALEAEISTRHLSFLETGRARPSRDMVLNLAERLDVPLRERNVLLLAAGFAPAFSECDLDEPALGPVRAAIDALLAGHEPHPALAVDRHWTMLAANRAVGVLLDGVAPALLTAPVNVLRLSLHPDGLAPRLLNHGEWRDHVLGRLRHQHRTTADAALEALLEELGRYPAPSREPQTSPAPEDLSPVVPLRLSTRHGELTLLSTTTVFGTPRDVTLSEIAIESFFPVDQATAMLMRRLAADETETADNGAR